ncbi:MAG: coenzyme F420-0:L-glutamate ligase [Candidatus Staskawiczbacteria bacterium]|nr:coenzyme F420-0:L-glutamate ligase [Candidatus Staskawiczbacteria bacterium]MBI3337191.1 coenzyme F420-0:L-glutamate ligase [Candidatus Staskawiczbacteria bacterium]
MELAPNPGKNLIIEVNGKKFARYPVRTKLITPEDKNISQIVKEYAALHLKPKDIIFISEKAVSVTQGRSYPKSEIIASKMANFLSSFVTKTPIGIGLGSPETMQLAIEEVGMPRILLAAFLGAFFKIFNIRGVFYIIAGSKARSIDGAVEYAIPPYNTYVSKGPIRANKVAEKVSEELKTPVAVVDANDFGVNILGASRGIDKKLVAKIIKDNPLGQSDEQTPIGIIREIF